MKKTTVLCRLLPTAVAGLLLLNGCASQQEMRKVNLDMHSMDSRLLELEDYVKQMKKQTGSTVDSVQKKQAGLGNTVDQLNTTLLQTKGQLEESRHRFRGLNAELIRIKKNLDQRLEQVENTTTARDREIAAKTTSLESEIGSLNDKLAGLQGGITSLDTEIESLGREIERIKKARLEEKAARARRAAEAASAAREKAVTASSKVIHRIEPTEVKKTVGTPEESLKSTGSEAEKTVTAAAKPVKKSSEQLEYEKGISKFRAGDYREAKEIFDNLRKKYSGKTTGIKSRFMIADCLFELGNYSLAILEYQQVISDHPRHEQVPHALYNQALAFEQLEDQKTAEIVYRKVIREFPDSNEANQAKKKI